jgi:multidrug transporter EmrE-like cation transporter
VSLSVQIGLLLALATALTSIVGFLMKHRGAVESPPIEARRPVRTSLALFRSRWYTLGIVVATGSWGLHVAALSLAPISLVQSVIAGGLVLLTVLADRVFGQDVTRREWIGVALIAIGLAFLAATLEGTGDAKHSAYDDWTLAVYVGSLAALGLGAAAGARRSASGGPVLAASAGLLWAGSDVTIKALSDHLDSGFGVLLNPLAVVIALLSLCGLTVSARSLQVGRAVPVIAVTSATANLCTIAAGPIVFGEPLPDDPAGLILRLLAFALVVAASALTPPPVAEVEPEPPARSRRPVPAESG